MTTGGFLVYGEALADLVPTEAEAARYDAILGGSGFNTALGLARFGARVALCASLSSDRLGRRFRSRLDEEAIDARWISETDAATPLAVVEPMGPDGVAAYRFHLAGTAFAHPAGAPETLAGFAHLHVTSFAAVAGQSGEVALGLMRQARREGVSVSYDINIRAQALPPLPEARRAIEDRVALCDLVKASTEDMSWLCDGDVRRGVERWRDLGAGALLVTDGAQGARFMGPSGAELAAPAYPVAVVDTIGAGDAFIAAFLGRLADHGPLSPERFRALDERAARDALEAASAFAAATCAVRGCDPPRHTALTNRSA